MANEHILKLQSNNEWKDKCEANNQKYFVYEVSVQNNVAQLNTQISQLQSDNQQLSKQVIHIFKLNCGAVVSWLSLGLLNRSDTPVRTGFFWDRLIGPIKTTRIINTNTTRIILKT